MSPIVSTTAVLVTGLPSVGDLRRIAACAHRVPITDGVWRVVLVSGGHGRSIAEALEVVHDVGVLAVDHVLVPQSGSS